MATILLILVCESSCLLGVARTCHGMTSSSRRLPQLLRPCRGEVNTVGHQHARQPHTRRPSDASAPACCIPVGLHHCTQHQAPLRSSLTIVWNLQVNPANPTGITLERPVLQRMADLTAAAGAWLVCDNTYVCGVQTAVKSWKLCCCAVTGQASVHFTSSRDAANPDDALQPLQRVLLLHQTEASAVLRYENFLYSGLPHVAINAPHVVHIFSFSKARPRGAQLRPRTCAEASQHLTSRGRPDLQLAAHVWSWG